MVVNNVNHYQENIMSMTRKRAQKQRKLVAANEKKQLKNALKVAHATVFDSVCFKVLAPMIDQGYNENFIVISKLNVSHTKAVVMLHRFRVGLLDRLKAANRLPPQEHFNSLTGSILLHELADDTASYLLERCAALKKDGTIAEMFIEQIRIANEEFLQLVKSTGVVMLEGNEDKIKQSVTIVKMNLAVYIDMINKFSDLIVPKGVAYIKHNLVIL